MITDSDFYTLFSAAVTAENKSAFVAESAGNSLTDKDAGELWDVAHMSTKDMRLAVGMTQAAFAQRICAPKRTVEAWESSSASGRVCLPYIRLLIAQNLGLYQRP